MIFVVKQLDTHQRDIYMSKTLLTWELRNLCLVFVSGGLVQGNSNSKIKYVKKLQLSASNLGGNNWLKLYTTFPRQARACSCLLAEKELDLLVKKNIIEKPLFYWTFKMHCTHFAPVCSEENTAFPVLLHTEYFYSTIIHCFSNIKVYIFM